MKKPSNKAIAIYLIWGLLHFALLFSPKNNGKLLVFGGSIFYPFTKGKVRNVYDYVNKTYNTIVQENNWDATAYDLSEFTFYMFAPILIYYAVSFWNKPKD